MKILSSFVLLHLSIFSSAQSPSSLWKQGEEAYKKNDCRSTILFLKKLSDQYPGEKGYIESHWMLGKCYENQNDYKLAKKHYDSYFRLKQQSISLIPKKNEYANLLIKNQESKKAKLLLLENLKLLDQSKNKDHPLYVPTLYVQALAELSLHQNISYFKTLRTLENKYRTQKSLFHDLSLSTLQLQGQLLECKLGSSSKMSEKESLEFLSDAQICILSSHKKYVEILQNSNLDAKSRSEKAYFQSLLDFEKLCKSPPPPSTPLSKSAQNEYQKELRSFYITQCNHFYAQLRNSLSEEGSGLDQSFRDRYLSILQEKK